MRLLLDTCAFLWLAGQPDELSGRAREAVTDPRAEVFLSAVSLWEILVKQMAGRGLPLNVPAHPEHYFIELRKRHDILPLPVDEEAVSRLTSLPNLHRDPFDRMLICQAIEHGLTILTPDEHIIRYPVRTLW